MRVRLMNVKFLDKIPERESESETTFFFLIFDFCILVRTDEEIQICSCDETMAYQNCYILHVSSCADGLIVTITL